MKKSLTNILKIFMILIISVLTISIETNIQKSVKVNQVSKKQQTEQTYNIDNVFKRDYWEWHTRTTSNDLAYNGEHIEIKNNEIIFYGYGQRSYKDFLYKEFEYAGKKTFKIKVDESAASYHTLEGAGFLINSSIKNNKISGYVILYGEKAINVYRIENLDLETFKTKANSTVVQYGKLVKTMYKVTSGIHNVVVEATPTSIKIQDNGQTMNVDLDYSKHKGNSFGLIASYYEHNCEILSKIVFEEFDLVIDNYKIPVKTINPEEKPLSGASYELKNENGTVVSKGTSNSSGIYNIIGLKEGVYTLDQTSAPSGYMPNNKVIKFKITSDGKAVDINTGKKIELIFINEPIKKEEDNNNNINNTVGGNNSNNNNNNQNNISNNNVVGNTVENNVSNTTANNVGNVNTNKLQNNKVNNSLKEEKLPSKLPQTGENLVVYILAGILISSIIYFSIKIRKYNF